MTLQELQDATPVWIEQDLTAYDIEAIQRGGCASGAYMPAVTYHQALATMQEYSDLVLELIEEHLGEVPAPSMEQSWAGMAVHFVSIAVELWASQFEPSGIEGHNDYEGEDD